MLFLPAQQRDKAAGYLGVLLSHVQAFKIIQTEAQQQFLCIRVLSLPIFHSLWDEAAAHPENNPHSFLLPGRRQKLASWNFHRRGISDKTEDPADQIGPEGCILNHAGQESPKFLCVSLTASTDSALS